MQPRGSPPATTRAIAGRVSVWGRSNMASRYGPNITPKIQRIISRAGEVPSALSPSGRQADDEPAALSHHTLSLDGAAVGLDEPADYGEPQPGSPGAAGPGGVGAVEAVEDPLQVLGRDSLGRRASTQDCTSSATRVRVRCN